MPNEGQAAAVSNAPSPDWDEVVAAARELALVRAEMQATRRELNALQTHLSIAKGHFAEESAARLVEANEQLVIAAVQAQNDSDQVALELQEVSNCLEIDVLTQLPNRLRLLDRFGIAIANARRHGRRLALLFLDLNDFKQVNDFLGHRIGDEVLKHAAHCLTSSIRETDTASRHGGDEFLILLSEISSVSDTAVVADKIIAALGVPLRIERHLLRLTASIGISIFPDDGEDIETLIDRADRAMYNAKRDQSLRFAFHGHAMRSEHSLRSDTSHRKSVSVYDESLAEHERQRALLQETNEQLLLAALSAQQMQAAAEQAQTRQLEFLAVLAHELRNPLMPLSLAASLLGQVGTDATRLARLQGIIAGQTVSLTRLVNDLLDVSRVRTGKLSLEYEVVDLTTLIEEAVASIRPALDIRLQTINVSIPWCTIRVYGDAVRLTQILSNLLGNASKYTHKGGTIDLSVKLESETVVVTVSDNGIGIPAESLPFVFDPFMQDVHAVEFNSEGLGVGLTVVQELVRGHGGTITATSAGIELGSQFVITMPTC